VRDSGERGKGRGWRHTLTAAEAVGVCKELAALLALWVEGSGAPVDDDSIACHRGHMASALQGPSRSLGHCRPHSHLCNGSRVTSHSQKWRISANWLYNTTMRQPCVEEKVCDSAWISTSCMCSARKVAAADRAGVTDRNHTRVEDLCVLRMCIAGEPPTKDDKLSR